MKLIRFGEINNEKPGVLLPDGIKKDVSKFVKDYDEHFFGNQGIEKLNNWLEKNHDSCPVIQNDVRLGPPLLRPSKIVCVGLNYSKHAKESGMDVPEEPVLFFRIGEIEDVSSSSGGCSFLNATRHNPFHGLGSNSHALERVA